MGLFSIECSGCNQVILFHRLTFSIQFNCNEGVGGDTKGEENETVGRDEEGLAREACRGFPQYFVFITSIAKHGNPPESLSFCRCNWESNEIGLVVISADLT